MSSTCSSDEACFDFNKRLLHFLSVLTPSSSLNSSHEIIRGGSVNKYKKEGEIGLIGVIIIYK